MPLEEWFYQMPICTRIWTTATVVTGVLVQCHLLSPFSLFYSFRAVFVKQQVSRNITGSKTSDDLELTIWKTVLANPLHVRLFRSIIIKPRLPHLLHSTLRAHARRGRCFDRTFRLATRLRRHHSSRRRPFVQPGVFGRHAELHARLHLESTKP